MQSITSNSLTVPTMHHNRMKSETQGPKTSRKSTYRATYIFKIWYGSTVYRSTYMFLASWASPKEGVATAHWEDSFSVLLHIAFGEMLLFFAILANQAYNLKKKTLSDLFDKIYLK